MNYDDKEDKSDLIQCPYCSIWCAKISPAHLKKHGKTMKDIKIEYPNQKLVSVYAQQRLEESVMRIYGVKNVGMLESSKETSKKTCMEIYNVLYPGQAEITKQHIAETNMRDRGCKSSLSDPITQEKIRITCNIEHGGNSSMSNPNVRAKAKKTIKDTYNVDNPGQYEPFKKKGIQTSLKEYGTRSPNQNEDVKNRKKETSRKNNGCDWALSSPKVRQKINETKLKNFIETKFHALLEYISLELLDGPYQHSKHYHKWKCDKCNCEFTKMWNSIQQGDICPNCNQREVGSSLAETEIREFISKYETIDVKNRSLIHPYELDIVIHSKKIAIEYCGIYWHSDSFQDDNYHNKKYQMCRDIGYRLITIFEDEWVLKKDLVQLKLLHIFGKSNMTRIGARQCVIKEISFGDKNTFLLENHIQGADRSKINIGAFYNDDLVSVMTFSKASIAKGSSYVPGIWELNRFATHKNFIICGIASRLLNYFKKTYSWTEIFSYADLRWSVGEVYYKLGFDLEHISKPNYWYVKGLNRIHRFVLRKRKDEPKDVSERILRASEGYRRIYDCGHMKFVIKS